MPDNTTFNQDRTIEKAEALSRGNIVQELLEIIHEFDQKLTDADEEIKDLNQQLIDAKEEIEDLSR